MTGSDIKLLLFGHDTVQCAYNLGAMESCRIDFERLAVQREAAKLSKSREPTVIDLGGVGFLRINSPPAKLMR